LHLSANGSLAKKQVCGAAEYQVTATAASQLDFNIPFIYLHIGAWWGPEQVYNSGVKPIGSICHAFTSADDRKPKAIAAPQQHALPRHMVL
jgi:hypothetical protein